MADAHAGGYNTFVPQYAASGEVLVNFSRNPKDFALNEYITLTNTKKVIGLYLKITVEECARILSSNLSDYEWPDGNDSPTNALGDEKFQFAYFRTRRYQYGFRLGYLAVEQADWKILASHAAIKAQQAMTGRTLLAVTDIINSANYSATHVKTATQWGGGFLDAGTAANPIFRKALLAMARRIHKDTFGVVGMKQLIVVMSPDLARSIAVSAEISDFLKSSPFALAQVRGDVPSQNGLWGMPDTYAGFKLVIEDAVYNPSRKGATIQAGTDIWPYHTLAMLARPGALVNNEGGPSFSTWHLFIKEEMSVETKDDPDERRHKGRIVDNFGIEPVAPVSGCLMTSCLSGAPALLMGDVDDEALRKDEEERPELPPEDAEPERHPESRSGGRKPTAKDRAAAAREQRRQAREASLNRPRNVINPLADKPEGVQEEEEPE